MKKTLACVALAGILLGAWSLGSPVVGAQTSTSLVLPLKLRAWAVNMSNTATGANTIVEITVNKWSIEAERQAFVSVFLEKGQDDLLKALEKAPAKGRIRYPNITGSDPTNMRLGYDLKYAWHDPAPEGGERLVIALDRYIGVREQASLSRTTDYPFTFIEIHLPIEGGEGVGKMSVATKLTFDKKKNIVEIENFSSEPVRLQQVTVQK